MLFIWTKDYLICREFPLTSQYVWSGELHALIEFNHMLSNSSIFRTALNVFAAFLLSKCRNSSKIGLVSSFLDCISTFQNRCPVAGSQFVVGFKIVAALVVMFCRRNEKEVRKCLLGRDHGYSGRGRNFPILALLWKQRPLR